MISARKEVAAAVQLAKDQKNKVARAEAEVASITNELNRAKYEAAETIQMLKNKTRNRDDALLARAREEVAEATKVAKAQQTIAAEAEKRIASTALELQQVRSELARREDAAETSEKAWRQERNELQRRVRQLAESVEQNAKNLEDSEAVRKQSANEVTWLSKQLAEQVAQVEALQDAQQQPGEQAAILAQALSRTEAELKSRTAECAEALAERRRLEANLSELRSAAGKAAAAREGLDQAGAQAGEELRLLRAKLDAESQSRRLAHDKIAQLQHEMAGYRQTVENPAVLHETEASLARRVKELTVAEEQVRNLTEELRAVRAGNAQQDERVDKLRRLAAGLKQKCDALEAGVKTTAQEQDQLRNELHEQTAMRQAAEAEVERLRQNPAPAKPEEPESEEIDADFIADLRQELQAAARTISPNRAAPADLKPSGPPGTPIIRKR
jgi:chromosome segregation ATPase